MKLRSYVRAVIAAGALISIVSLAGCSPKATSGPPPVKPGVPIGPGNMPPPPGGTLVIGPKD